MRECCTLPKEPQAVLQKAMKSHKHPYLRHVSRELEKASSYIKVDGGYGKEVVWSLEIATISYLKRAP